MRPLAWFALGLAAFGGCSLAGGRSHRERLAAVPRVTCDQLARAGVGLLAWLGLGRRAAVRAA